VVLSVTGGNLTKGYSILHLVTAMHRGSELVCTRSQLPVKQSSFKSLTRAITQMIMRASTITIAIAIVLGQSTSGACQNIGIVPGSTEPRIQLTGENFQIYSNGTYFTDFVPGRTMSRYGVLGTDLGYPVVYPDKIVFLFGDTMAVTTSPKRLEGKPTGRRGREPGMPVPVTTGGPVYYLDHDPDPVRPNDSIGYIPNTDLSQCHYILQVQEQLQKGNSHPSVPTSSCPAIQFYENPHHGPTDHPFMATNISGLQPSEGLGPYRVPTGALDYNGSLYMFYVVDIQEAKPRLALKSIVAKADQPHTQWSNKQPPTFHRLYTVSTHPMVEDVSKPPSEEGSYGKFMFNPVVTLDAATISSAGLTKGLPSSLQHAAQVVFILGSSWNYNRSNLYLAAFNVADVEAGTSKWFYYTGQDHGANSWSNDEKMAAPLLTGTPNVGNHSVVWNATLHRFVLMYGILNNGRVVAQVSPTPWGPWSPPMLVLGSQSDWARRLIHHPSQDPIVRNVIPVHGPAGRVLDVSKDTMGVPYGPNLIDRYTTNGDGSVTVYFTMSTWNPYEVFVVSTTFKAGN